MNIVETVNDIFFEEISARFELSTRFINCILKYLEIYEEIVSPSKFLIELGMYYKIKEAKESNSFDKISGLPS